MFEFFISANMFLDEASVTPALTRTKVIIATSLGIEVVTR